MIDGEGTEREEGTYSDLQYPFQATGDADGVVENADEIDRHCATADDDRGKMECIGNVVAIHANQQCGQHAYDDGRKKDGTADAGNGKVSGIALSIIIVDAELMAQSKQPPHKNSGSYEAEDKCYDGVESH